MIAVAGLIIATFLGHMFLGPVAALLQSLAGVRRRATAAAFYLFLVNLVSMGVGPTVVGLASDRLATTLGSDALRWALLLVVASASFFASGLFWLAARCIPRGLHGGAPGGAAHALHSSSATSS
jgi:hypothetical protein